MHVKEWAIKTGKSMSLLITLTINKTVFNAIALVFSEQ